MPYLTKDQLLLPRKDGFGNPTTEPDWHTLPTPDGGEAQIFGYMGDDDQAYWHYTLGFFTKGIGLELGAFYGYSSILAGLGMRHSPWGGKLISIDWFAMNSVQYLKGDNTLERFNENLKTFGVEDYVTGVQGSCEDPDVIPFTEVEWVFQDASHCEKEILINWDIFYPMLKPGGLWVIHDTNQPDPPRVMRQKQEECGIVPVITDRKEFEVWMKPL